MSRKQKLFHAIKAIRFIILAWIIVIVIAESITKLSNLYLECL